MKDKTRLGIKLKIASATSVVLFTLLTVFVGTYTWFQTVTENHNNGDDFVIDNPTATISAIEFYDLNTIDDDNYIFNDTPIASAMIQGESASLPSDTIALGTYMPDSPNHPILMLVEITGESLNISANTTSDSTIYITDNLDGQGKPIIPSGTTNPMSSVVQFYSVGFSKATDDPTSKASRTNINNHTISILKSELTDNNQSSFAQIENGEKTGFEKNITLFDGQVGEYAYMGIIIDYFPDSVQYIYSYYMGSNVNVLGYICDWGMSL